MMNTHTQARNRSRRGFTLIEALVVIVIIGVLAAIIGPPLFGNIIKGKKAAAAANAATIATQVKTYQMDYGAMPNSLNDLLAKSSDGKFGPYLENADQLIDPWGHPFQLRVPPQKNAFFDIVCLGADGQPGGEGDNEDIVKP